MTISTQIGCAQLELETFHHLSVKYYGCAYHMTGHVTFNEKKLWKYQNSQLTLFVDPHGIYIFPVF